MALRKEGVRTQSCCRQTHSLTVAVMALEAAVREVVMMSGEVVKVEAPLETPVTEAAVRRVVMLREVAKTEAHLEVVAGSDHRSSRASHRSPPGSSHRPERRIQGVTHTI